VVSSATQRRWLIVGCAGALGGAINAWLVLKGIPVVMKGEPDLDWSVVPAGALHGAVLAVLPVASAFAVVNRTALIRMLTVVPVGWLAGYLSWIPIHRWGGQESWRHSLLWLSRLESGAAATWAPFVYFGMVSALLYLSILWGLFDHGLAGRVAWAIAAGVLGSLWFWTDSQPWYFSPIHGSIWGGLVGVGIGRLTRESIEHGVAEQGVEADEA
jgi:hypothetical protein